MVLSAALTLFVCSGCELFGAWTVLHHVCVQHLSQRGLDLQLLLYSKPYGEYFTHTVFTHFHH